MSSNSLLQRGLVHYPHRVAAGSDIQSANESFHSLQLRVNNYTFDTGQTSPLLCLEGTIPVTYMGALYNIPVAIYFVPNHPYSPPMAYVRPTASMQIKPGINVDTNGKIYLPYLSDWKPPGSTTLQLLYILQEVFGNRPPVFSKSKPTNQTPSNVGFNDFATAAPGGVAYRMPGTGWSGNSGGGSPGGMVMPGLPGGPASSPNSGSTGYYGGGSMPSIPAMVTTTPYVNSGTALSSSATEEEAVLVSLKSAIFDKIHREQQELSQVVRSEIESLETTQTSLKTRRNALDTYQAQMASELHQIKAATRELEEKTKEYGDAYKQLKKEADGHTDYDSVVDTTTPVYRQLFEAFAEEQAIDDLLYYLTQALEKGAIGSEDFLKTVRDQSRKQFMLRATVTQCRIRAGLPPV